MIKRIKFLFLSLRLSKELKNIDRKIKIVPNILNYFYKVEKNIDVLVLEVGG